MYRAVKLVIIFRLAFSTLLPEGIISHSPISSNRLFYWADQYYHAGYSKLFSAECLWCFLLLFFGFLRSSLTYSYSAAVSRYLSKKVSNEFEGVCL